MPSHPLQTITNLYTHLLTLTPTSPPSALDHFASYFSPSCKVYLKSMREANDPAVDHAAIVRHLRDYLKDQVLEQRNVVSQAVSEDGEGARVFLEMENRYNVHGQILDRFPETLVATFDEEGLINSFKLYSCRSHVIMLIQSATGEGPYSEEMMKNPHSH
ncbi:hypothetical protein M440DRAFT_355917 [Trichoderma longibrachiatum ATCC 18648]|uniref:Uncharacterized protein n=1 Tax=Trichoderma longibrachiatum ATCC 18648 TaxID=983965 RepID=A0A2T4C294_TRILO|nr:hypothetical protein M440DRAFT_355917 [Trichoderma longibrachiatum ATCC 18648]